MKKNYKKSMFASGIISVLFLILSFNTEAQNSQQSVNGKRVRECFDRDWMFHKGDIAIKYAFNTSKYGGLTDTNVKVVSDETTVIDYTDVMKLSVFKPADWQKTDLPHDWLVEETFVNDNSLGIQPASNGYLPVGIGFYRKES
jgi:beta-galactosidase